MNDDNCIIEILAIVAFILVIWLAAVVDNSRSVKPGEKVIYELEMREPEHGNWCEHITKEGQLEHIKSLLK